MRVQGGGGGGGDSRSISTLSRRWAAPLRFSSKKAETTVAGTQGGERAGRLGWVGGRGVRAATVRARGRQLLPPYRVIHTYIL